MSNKIKLIIHLLTMLIIIWTLTPVLNRIIPIVYIVPLTILWAMFVFLITVKLKGNLKVQTSIFFSFAWIFLILVYRLIGFSNAALGNYFAEILFFMFFWIGLFYTNHMGEKYRRQIFNFTMVISTFNILHNIYLLYIYPNASVQLNYSDIYNTTNVGGTTFSLFTLIFFSFVILVSKYNQKITQKIIYIFLGICCVIYIFQASRATIIIFLLITVGIYSYTKLISNKKYIEKIIYSISIFLLTFLLILNIEVILTLISSNINNDRLVIRLEALSNAIAGKLSENDIALTSRTELYEISILTFFGSIKNFIFGVGYHTTTNLSLSWIRQDGVGNHSEFFDLAARYGIIGVLLIYYFFRSFIIGLRKYYDSNNYLRDNIILVIFLLYSFLNNTFDSSIGVLLFLIYPIYLKNRNGNRGEVAVSN